MELKYTKLPQGDTKLSIGVGRCFILGGPNILSVTGIAPQKYDARIALATYVVRKPACEAC